MSTISMQSATFVADGEQDGDDPSGYIPTAVEQAAEQAVLGSMLLPTATTHRDGTAEQLNSPAIGDVANVLQPQHLYRPKHQAIFTAILDIAGRGETVDAISAAAELEQRGELARVGGAPYLHTLMAHTPTATNAVYYAEQVRQAANRRAAIEYATRIHHAAAARDGEHLDVAMDHAWRVYETAVAGAETDALGPVTDDADTLTAVLDQWGTESPSAFTTGLTDVDAVLNVDRGGLVVIGARSGVGKSALASRIARHYAFDRHENTLVFNMEMSRKQLVERDYAAMARVRLDSASGKTALDQHDWDKLVQAAARYQEHGHRLHIDDTHHVGLAHIRARMRQIHHQHKADSGIGLVVVDQLNLMKRADKDREDQELTEITRQLKVLAGEYDCVVVLVTQVNRNPEARSNGKPRASDLKGSGGTEQDADVVMLLHDVGVWDDARIGEIDLILDKQRKGISHATVPLTDKRHQANFECMSWPRSE